MRRAIYKTCVKKKASLQAPIYWGEAISLQKITFRPSHKSFRVSFSRHTIKSCGSKSLLTSFARNDGKKRLYAIPIFFTFIFLLSSISLFGQKKNLSDTIIKLQPVQTYATYKRAENTGFQVQNIDSDYIQQHQASTIADALKNESQVQIKTYGNSMLASATYRGLAARHTGVFWNGVNINQAGIGMIDLNLVPMIVADKISVWQGGSAALLGSGNMAGSIHLTDIPNFNDGLKIGYNQGFGSFGLHSETGKLQLSGKKVYSQTIFQNKAAQNNYSYINPNSENNELEKQRNAAYHQMSLVENLGFNLKKYGLLSIHYWYENSNREIPPTLYAANSDARQKDISHKGVISWKNTFKKWHIHLIAADLWDELNYTDTVSRIASNYQLNTLIFKAKTEYNINKHFKYYLNVAGNFYTMHNTSYIDSILNRNLLEGNMGLSGRFFKNKLSATANLGFSRKYKTNSPITPSVGAKYRLFKFLTLRGNASYNYTFPTLNDLYWQPGGNPDLLPEQGWAYEGGMDLKIKKNKHLSNKAYFTAFSQKVKNWIAWIPSDKGYWLPTNYKKVYSRGVEVGWNSFYKLKKSSFKLNLNYSYTLATNESVGKKNDASLHRQLIYVPYYKGNATLTYRYKNLQIRLNTVYNGAEFATSDNTTLLPAYWLLNSGVFYDFKLKKFKISAGLKLNNITNKFYQPLLGYIMPGRNFEANVKILFE